jgi:hypothetical protein
LWWDGTSNANPVNLKKKKKKINPTKILQKCGFGIFFIYNNNNSYNNNNKKNNNNNKYIIQIQIQIQNTKYKIQNTNKITTFTNLLPQQRKDLQELNHPQMYLSCHSIYGICRGEERDKERSRWRGVDGEE